MKSVALRDELIGTWKLVSYVETLVDGSPRGSQKVTARFNRRRIARVSA